MNLKKISDNLLLENIKELVKKELKITAEIITHLEEVDRRKLFSDLKYRSLFDYSVMELGYSEDQAYRRINAMRLSRKIPEVKEKIDCGELNLTNVNLLSGFFKELDLQATEKSSVIEKVSNKSKRECQNILMEIREDKGVPAPIKKCVVKNESTQTVRLSVSISKKTMEKIEQIKGMFAHQNLELGELIDLMAEALIDQKKEELVPQKKGKEEGKGRYIPKKVKHEAMKKAGYKCEKCGSSHALQYEHVIPYSVGGKSNIAGIKVLCRNCNLRAGIKFFGVEKMTAPTISAPVPESPKQYDLVKDFIKNPINPALHD